MILAAGRGERMRPLSDTIPKPLLEVAGKPLIVHTVEKLVAAGFMELVVNLGYRGRQIRDFLDDGSRWGATIAYSDEGGRPIGTGAGPRSGPPIAGTRAVRRDERGSSNGLPVRAFARGGGP